MFVREIYQDCQQITGFSDEATNLSRISDAVECLANKGNIEALQAYVTVTADATGKVVLPLQVEIPISVNLDSKPSFSRGKMYEFSMNGPGSGFREDLGWEDQGTTPINGELSAVTNVKATSSMADDGKFIRIKGMTASSEIKTETLTLNSATPPVSVNLFKRIDEIAKDVTSSTVTISDAQNNPIGIYPAAVTNPEFRIIRVSRPNAVAKILYRQKVFRVYSQDDFIPIQSRMGLLLMLRANEFYRRAMAEDIKSGQALEEQAAKFVEEEQKSRQIFVDYAANTQKDSSRGLQVANRDSLIVADVYDEFAEMFGSIGEPKIFDMIGDAVTLLSNKGLWDGLMGVVDIQTDQYKFVTLPRYVDGIVAINVNYWPAQMRNRLYEFHLNGPSQQYTPVNSWKDVGTTPVYRDVRYTQNLVAGPDLEEDNGTQIRVFGYFQDKWIMTEENGALVDGFLVDCNIDLTINNPVNVDRITRITKAKSKGFIQLLGTDVSGENLIPLGYYAPDETEPNYRKIELPTGCNNVRIVYRKRSLKVSSLTEPLHLRIRLPVICAARAIQAMQKGDYQSAEIFERKALQYLNEDKMARDPSQTFSFQMDRTVGASQEHAQY